MHMHEVSEAIFTIREFEKTRTEAITSMYVNTSSDVGAPNVLGMYVRQCLGFGTFLLMYSRIDLIHKMNRVSQVDP